MKLYPQDYLCNFACNFAVGMGAILTIGLSIGSIIVNSNAPVNAQSFPNDSAINTSTGSTQYLVYLANVTAIKQAKILAPDAFVNRLDTGEQIVQIGRFNNLNLAQRRVSQFNQAGLSAQIKTVQGRLASIPPTLRPNNPTYNNVPANSAPIPVESIPISTTRTNDALPGVPGSELPQTNSQTNSQTNAIEIVRSPQPISQPIPQPIPIQSVPQSIPQNTSKVATNTSQLRYFVIIPSNSFSELQRVQEIAPSAQLRSSYRGTYIEVQGYPERLSAETFNATIRSKGFDSRVVFF